MIFVRRQAEPNSLVKNKDRWLQNYLDAINVYNANRTKQNKKRKENAENKYRQADVKLKLKSMFEDKCAYCESYLAHVSYGNIEHFKPKVKFPNDCFNWENLLLGCDICNGPLYKSTNFPLVDEGGPLVNPTSDNPSDFFDFEYDPVTGLANVLGKDGRGRTSEIILGLNRPELIKYRSRVVRKIVFVAIKASQGDQDALAEMQKLVDKEEEYSAFSIMLARKYNLGIV